MYEEDDGVMPEQMDGQSKWATSVREKIFVYLRKMLLGSKFTVVLQFPSEETRNAFWEYFLEGHPAKGHPAGGYHALSALSLKGFEVNHAWHDDVTKTFAFKMSE
ncbi:hypothetical protein LCGC14_2670080 [marine sediment metagenome]|uniref:Uncharacterized protein n=1 Tax=marine sediment metagenome TaxID=412755 RepID=A0A0F8ZPD2_9ZZZZ